MTGGTDRASTVRALVRGESAVAFETALQDARTNEDGEMVTISLDSVNKALEAVTHSAFPYHALETQRLWMNRKMFKPSELTTRQMAASINRLNNALPFFQQDLNPPSLLKWKSLGYQNGPYLLHGELSLI